MASAFGSTHLGLYDIVTSVAATVAIALNSQLDAHYRLCSTTSKKKFSFPNELPQVSSCFCKLGSQLRALKTDFATLHEEEHLIGLYLDSATRTDRQQFESHLCNIMLCLESVIDADYVGRFCPQHGIEDTHVRQLYYILRERPSDFDDSRILQSSKMNECFPLLPSLDWISRSIKYSSLSYFEYSQTAHAPPILLQHHQASKSVHDLAIRLHKSLHQGWPCRSEHDEGHEGKLGQCTHANIRLDPKWIRDGTEDGAFFIILSLDDLPLGDTMYQECKVHLTISRSVEDGDPLCLREYADTEDVCLYLFTDEIDMLWDDENLPLDLQLPAHGCSSYGRHELIPLQEMIPRMRMNYKGKRYLQLVLVRALLPLLAGPWMDDHLSVYDISILCTVQDNRYFPRLENLFLSSQFGNSRRASRKKAYGHPFPAIQALGILMAEIELGNQIDESSQNISLKKHGEILLGQCRDRLPETVGVLQALQFCLDKTSFLDFRPQNGETGMKDADEFSALYYGRIIRPLEKDLVDGCLWTWDEASWKSPKAIDISNEVCPMGLAAAKLTNQARRSNGTPHTILRAKELESSRNNGYRHLKRDSFSFRTETVYDARGCISGDSLNLETSEWFRKVKDMRTVLDCARKEISKSDVKRLIKVAVLDTGVDVNHPVFQEWRLTGQLDTGLNLINRGQPMTDTDGHGTHVCHTLLKTAPNIKLYPIRIFEGRDADESTPSLVAEAIRFAVNIWDVDIISMSFAFNDNHKVIEDAIRCDFNEQSRKQVLYFAAASNNRFLENEPIGFPGRLTDRVFCVFSSSEISGQRSSFSPEGVQSQPNFSVVGENIEAAWLTSDANANCFKAMSGTSCATPIVAGIAALLLDFVRQNKEELSSWPAWNSSEYYLQSFTGMKSVLSRCMTDSGYVNGNYNLLKPWKLLQGNDTKFIASRIYEALQRRSSG